MLVDVGDVRASAAAMIQLARSSEDRERLGSKTRDSVWARFHPDVVLPMYENIYTQLLHAWILAEVERMDSSQRKLRLRSSTWSL